MQSRRGFRIVGICYVQHCLKPLESCSLICSLLHFSFYIFITYKFITNNRTKRKKKNVPSITINYTSIFLIMFGFGSSFLHEYKKTGNILLFVFHTLFLLFKFLFFLFISYIFNHSQHTNFTLFIHQMYMLFSVISQLYRT